MKLTKRQLRIIIENYLVEQDSDNSDPESEELIDDEPEAEETPAEEPVDSEVSDETGTEETGDETPSEDTPPDDEPPEESDSVPPDKFKSFQIIVDDEKHTIQFLKDEAQGVLKIKIDDTTIKNPTPQDFVTMAGLGLQGDAQGEDRKNLENLVKKIDKSFEKFRDVGKAVQRKMNAERQGFSIKDIRDTIRKKNR
mgnify:CR=1 FL=1